MNGEPPEKELCSFGPRGVRICFSRPGFFTPLAKNITRIVLTDKGISGEPQTIGNLSFFKDKAGFQVPINSIALIERFSFFLNKGLYIQYRDAERTREVSIISSDQNLSQIYELIQKALHKP
ncbi:hypothetical protein MUP77_06245 [Candidatus Bathyarchaeota archaeon]|nr:hypothetical protein [Candidatus Bathyarchaeota archaeon]